MNDLDLAFAPTTTLVRMLGEKSVTSIQLTKLFLSRLERFGPGLNAIAEITEDVALEQATLADSLLAAGQAPSPLTGIPYGAKDLLATAGIPTRWGSPAHASQVFDEDATVISKLREAGAVLVAKLAMVEMAGGGGYDTPKASLHGPGRNPWDRKRWAGGSSSGSAAAVAAGLLPFALGSETWGSIVTPAAFCGVTGLRPTHGLVSRHGAMELSWQMDKVGPLARTARDCRLILDTISGPDPLDPTTATAGPAPRTRAIRTLGILPLAPGVDPTVAAEFAAALETLVSAGYKTIDVSFPEHSYADVASTILNGDIAAVHEDFIRSPERLKLLRDPNQRRGLREALRGNASDYASALRQREEIRRDINGLFDHVDALVSPALSIEAPLLTGSIHKAFEGAGGYSVLGSLCSLPEIVLPIGSGPNDLPIGLSLIGPAFGDTAIARVGQAFQRHTAWHGRRPPGTG